MGTWLLSGVGEGSLKVSTSDPLPVAGNAENGPSLLPTRLFGGLPRVFPLALLPPILQAEDTTFAPWRLDRALDGVMADFGSSAQKVFLVEGVMAEWG